MSTKQFAPDHAIDKLEQGQALLFSSATPESLQEWLNTMQNYDQLYDWGNCQESFTFLVTAIQDIHTKLTSSSVPELLLPNSNDPTRKVKVTLETILSVTDLLKSCHTVPGRKFCVIDLDETILRKVGDGFDWSEGAKLKKHFVKCTAKHPTFIYTYAKDEQLVRRKLRSLGICRYSDTFSNDLYRKSSLPNLGCAVIMADNYVPCLGFANGTCIKKAFYDGEMGKLKETSDWNNGILMCQAANPADKYKNFVELYLPKLVACSIADYEVVPLTTVVYADDVLENLTRAMEYWQEKQSIDVFKDITEIKLYHYAAIK